MIDFRINGMFICDRCRHICGGPCHEQLMNIKKGVWREGDEQYEKNKDLIGRKNIIHCLGKYCDNPCQYQREEYTPFNEEDGLQPLITAINYLGKECHKMLDERNKEIDISQENSEK